MGEDRLPARQAQPGRGARLLNLLAAALGLLLLALLLADVTTTTLSTRGSGPLSGQLAHRLWSAALWLHRRRESHGLLERMGVLILSATLAMWLLLLWLGWGLLFLAGSPAVVDSSSGTAAAWPQVFYFAGYTLITLGNGEFRPEGALWQLATVLTATLGFFVVTLAVTYLLSVLPVVVLRRQVASYLAGLGLEPQALVLRCWRSANCSGLADHVPTLAQGIGTLAQQHLAFPIVHYFHASRTSTVFSLRLAALDETLTILRHGLVDEREETARQLEPLRAAIDELLVSLQGDFLTASDEAPPPPSLEPLRAAGLPVRDEAAFAEALRAEAGRRRKLLALVRQDGWRWAQIGQHPPPLGGGGEGR